MGVLGWEPKAVRAADVNDIVLALENRRSLLISIFGGKEPPKKTKPTVNQLRSFFRAHNDNFGKTKEAASGSR